jgi:hypothetical protein
VSGSGQKALFLRFIRVPIGPPRPERLGSGAPPVARMRAGDRLAPPGGGQLGGSSQRFRRERRTENRFPGFVRDLNLPMGLASMFVREIACEIGKDGKGFALRAAWLSGRSR